MAWPNALKESRKKRVQASAGSHPQSWLHRLNAPLHFLPNSSHFDIQDAHTLTKCFRYWICVSLTLHLARALRAWRNEPHWRQPLPAELHLSASPRPPSGSLKLIQPLLAFSLTLSSAHLSPFHILRPSGFRRCPLWNRGRPV